jgi:hypothetical protein
MPTAPRPPKIPSVLRPYHRKFTSPHVDMMFKRVFGTEKNKPILMAFLHEITGAKILDLVIANTEVQNLTYAGVVGFPKCAKD